MDLQHDFDRSMTALEDWYADSVRARAYDAATGRQANDDTVPHVNRYPGPPWRRLWAELAKKPVAQAAIIHALHDEIYAIGHSPSRATPASGLHRNTKDWRRAVATAPGTLRAVAREFGITHTEVRRLRMDFT